MFVPEMGIFTHRLKEGGSEGNWLVGTPSQLPRNGPHEFFHDYDVLEYFMLFMALDEILEPKELSLST